MKIVFATNNEHKLKEISTKAKSQYLLFLRNTETAFVRTLTQNKEAKNHVAPKNGTLFKVKRISIIPFIN